MQSCKHSSTSLFCTHADEVNCTVYKKPPSYIKTMAPAPVDGNATVVCLDVSILAILEISEVGSYIFMQLSVQLSW